MRQIRTEKETCIFFGGVVFDQGGARGTQARLFTMKTQLTRGNDAECVQARRGERRTKPIFVSQLALPPAWAVPLCKTSHGKALPLPRTTGPRINVQMYARKFSEKPKLLCQMR